VCGVKMHFGCFLKMFLLAMFSENVLSTFPQFMCPETKLFAVKFRQHLGSFWLESSGVTNVGRGVDCLPGKLNLRNGPPLKLYLGI